MDKHRFKRVKEIFQAALKIDSDRRSPFLEEACGGDPALREEVERLLRREDESKSFLETPALAGPSTARVAEERVGTRIGQYLIKRVISSGGMGTVYEAVQEQPERAVAVKVMNQGLDSPSALRRFEYEAQVLARLRHPNIAQVIEAGTMDAAGPVRESAEGLPYFVMEFIHDALPLNEYATKGELPFRERLELFGQACDAVHYGHQKGIIHRDLKPGNILVDGEGRVKIIDFGIARATDSDLALTTARTEVGQLLDTLQYMSPEQCEADPDKLDVRSDVYALGVVLYELLCDELPYDVQKAAVFEAVRLIRERPPKRPSTVKRFVRGDLETILLKALEKERSQRYQTVADFSTDIERYLKGEVILAKPAGLARKIWKQAKRNPVVSGAVSVALLTLLGFVGYVLLYSYPEIIAEQKRALDAEKEANEQRAAAVTARREIEEQYNEIIRLSDVKWLADLEKEALELWPAYPETIDRINAWIARAEELADRLPLHRRTLERIREQAQISEGDSTPPDGKFSDREREWQYAVLPDLIAGLTAFTDEKTGTLRDVKSRLDFAENVEQRSLVDHRAAWDRAVRSIGDRSECPQYKGLQMKPMMGFVPLGINPATGLWEFGHLQTGVIPETIPDGRILFGDESSLVFVLIPGGTFLMGAEKPTDDEPIGSSNRDPDADVDEGPIRTVTVAPFLISKFEMTQGQWLRFTGHNPSNFSLDYYMSLEGAEPERVPYSNKNPVEQVSWIDCVDILGRLKLRLPTEAEWEYAARAGTSTVWWTGNKKESLDGAANIADRFCKAHGGPPQWNYEEWLDDGWMVHCPAGRLIPNPFGLHNTCGNVYEWCQDSYDGPRGYEKSPTDGSAYVSEGLKEKVFRGGSWNHTAHDCRSANRLFADAVYVGAIVGVRPACSLPE